MKTSTAKTSGVTSPGSLSKAAGFSLLEVILGLVLLSLLTSIVMVNTSTYMNRLKQKEMKTRIVSLVELGRERVFETRQTLDARELSRILSTLETGNSGVASFSEGFRIHPPGACDPGTGVYSEADQQIAFRIEELSCRVTFL